MYFAVRIPSEHLMVPEYCNVQLEKAIRKIIKQKTLTFNKMLKLQLLLTLYKARVPFYWQVKTPILIYKFTGGCLIYLHKHRWLNLICNCVLKYEE